MLQWYADNLTCKMLMMMRTGGYILSSNLLVVLSIDRLVAERQIVTAQLFNCHSQTVQVSHTSLKALKGIFGKG